MVSISNLFLSWSGGGWSGDDAWGGRGLALFNSPKMGVGEGGGNNNGKSVVTVAYLVKRQRREKYNYCLINELQVLIISLIN